MKLTSDQLKNKFLYFFRSLLGRILLVTLHDLFKIFFKIIFFLLIIKNLSQIFEEFYFSVYYDYKKFEFKQIQTIDVYLYFFILKQLQKYIIQSVKECKLWQLFLLIYARKDNLICQRCDAFNMRVDLAFFYSNFIFLNCLLFLNGSFQKERRIQGI